MFFGMRETAKPKENLILSVNAFMILLLAFL